MNLRAPCLLVCTAILVISSNVSRAKDEPAPIFPKALAPGDTIEIIAPAKYLDKGRVTLATKRLEELGFKVRVPRNLFRKQGFLGGSDEERTAELMDAFADPAVKAILPGTGGYGTTRIANLLHRVFTWLELTPNRLASALIIV
jgi:muramoyltetrapeptide carboxypeptidase LdcA involved in peptidoglycan recycling